MVFQLQSLQLTGEFKMPNPEPPSAAEISQAILQAMTDDLRVPKNRITVSVNQGCVTLEGNVDWDFQRQAAAALATHVPGVHAVLDNVTVNSSVSPSEFEARIEARIENALRNSSAVEPWQISVSAVDGTVHLAGNVGSWFEREEAIQAASAAPGVSNVVDDLSVAPDAGLAGELRWN
jgi:osmotically-inducible protein OsmY